MYETGSLYAFVDVRLTGPVELLRDRRVAKAYNTKPHPMNSICRRQVTLRRHYRTSCRKRRCSQSVGCGETRHGPIVAPSFGAASATPQNLITVNVIPTTHCKAVAKSEAAFYEVVSATPSSRGCDRFQKRQENHQDSRRSARVPALSCLEIGRPIVFRPALPVVK